MIREASEKDADLLILPELFMAYLPFSEPHGTFISTAEPIDGPFVASLAAEARKRKMHVVVGIYETSARKGRVHNTVVLLGADGSIIAHHRKVQLFDSFGYRESSHLAPGKELEGVFRTPLATMGMLTCYELRFPELARMLALQGAEVIIVPTAWVAGQLKEEHLRVLARARALENTVFVAVACQTGRMFTGRSMLVDPFGVPIYDAGEEEGVSVTEIDLGRIIRVRQVLPSLSHLRSDLYAEFWKARPKRRLS
jgi:predicted amidohydrolase